MDRIGKAIWIVESNVTSDIALDDIADRVGLSRFHLTRAFGQSFGRSLISYLRGRRLSEAAKRLASGAPDILQVALEAGYGSHEAFTRAFRGEFGLTPERFRSAPDLTSIKLTEAFHMNGDASIKLNPPRIERHAAMLFAGIGQRFDYEGLGDIPLQWQKFGPHIGAISGEVRDASYGVCANSDATGLDYVSAVEVRDFAGIPE